MHYTPVLFLISSSSYYYTRGASLPFLLPSSLAQQFKSDVLQVDVSIAEDRRGVLAQCTTTKDSRCAISYG
jgi:hypothetical protein